MQAREAIHKGDVVVVPVRRSCTFVPRVFTTRSENRREQRSISDHIRHEHIQRTARYSHRYRECAQPNQNPDLHVHQHKCRSAGSLIAIATHHIYMAPVSAIGAAAPILSTGEDLPTTAKEKTIFLWFSLVPRVRNQERTQSGRRRGVHDKNEDEDGDRVVHPKGAVLTLNAQEATERINGKPLLAEGVADSVPDLTKKAGLKGNIATIEPSGFEQITFWITALAPLLLLGGILGAYFEFKIPGVSLAGNHRCDLFRLFFPRPLPRRPRRLGSRCAIRGRSGCSFSSRSSSSRIHDCRSGLSASFSSSLAAVDDDRSLSRSDIFSRPATCCDAGA